MRFFVFLTALLLVCAQSQAKPVFQRYIDESYTTPYGQKQFFFTLGYLGQKFLLSKEAEPQILASTEFRMPLEEGLELVFAPLPLGVRYRVPSQDGIERGVSWSLDFLDIGRFGLKPTFSSYTRWRRNDHSTVELDFSYYIFIPFRTSPTSGSFDLMVGPAWQLSPEIAYGVKTGLSSGAYYILRADRSDLPEGQVYDPRKSRFTWPLTGFVDYRTRSGWETKFSYSYYGFALDPNDFEHVVTARFSRSF